jgi:hypothetical protein
LYSDFLLFIIIIIIMVVRQSSTKRYIQTGTIESVIAYQLFERQERNTKPGSTCANKKTTTSSSKVRTELVATSRHTQLLGIIVLAVKKENKPVLLPRRIDEYRLESRLQCGVQIDSRQIGS